MRVSALSFSLPCTRAGSDQALCCVSFCAASDAGHVSLSEREAGKTPQRPAGQVCCAHVRADGTGGVGGVARKPREAEILGESLGATCCSEAVC